MPSGKVAWSIPVLVSIAMSSFIAVSPVASAESNSNAMKEAAIQQYREHDSFAAIATLAGESDPLAATKAFFEVMRHFYWKEKDLAASLAFARAGVQHGLSTAATVESKDEALAYELRSIAKGMAYDIASFTWPGWDEQGISITDADLKIGMDAAKTNLRLAKELNKGSLPTSRAWWVLAVHQMAIGRYEEAIASFEQGAQSAETANSEADLLLNQGFAALARVLQTDGKSGAVELNRVKEQLRKVKEGDFFVEQIEMAVKVFSK